MAGFSISPGKWEGDIKNAVIGEEERGIPKDTRSSGTSEERHPLDVVSYTSTMLWHSFRETSPKRKRVL